MRAAAEAQGLRLRGSVYANVASALSAGKHLVLTGAPGSGKTTLALAIAQAAATSGRSSGAVLVTAGERWTSRDTLGARPRPGAETPRPGHVIAAASRGKWLVIDELDRADVDRAFGGLSSFLAGLPVTLPSGEEASAPKDWRIIATAARALDATPALWRRFAHVELPASSDEEIEAAIVAAAGGDWTAAGAARRLLVLRELRDIGAGVYVDAAAHAAERNAIEPADERTLAREATTPTSRGCSPASTTASRSASGSSSAGCRWRRTAAPRSGRRSPAPRRAWTGSTTTRGRCSTARTRIWEAPWLFRLPWFRRFHGYESCEQIFIRRPLAEVSDDLIVHELCHVWQEQHGRLRMWLSYLRGYRENANEVEARRAVAETR